MTETLTTHATEPIPDQVVDSNVEIHKYCIEYLNNEKIFVLIILLKSPTTSSESNVNTAWVWAGSQEAPVFKHLSVAMQSKYVSYYFPMVLIGITTESKRSTLHSHHWTFIHGTANIEYFNL